MSDMCLSTAVMSKRTGYPAMGRILGIMWSPLFLSWNKKSTADYKNWTEALPVYNSLPRKE